MRALIRSTAAYALLQSEARANRLNHAYLLAFDDGRNLRAALREFAKLFFKGEGEERRNALIEKENFSDCLFFPEAGKKFSVEDAEKISEESALRPVEGERKLFVIGDFAEATPQAQNKLLKILEEPPKNVFFLLGATVIFPVLPTVLSRTAKLEIPPFSEKQVADCLERIYRNDPLPGSSAKDFSLYAATSGGKVGAAQDFLEGGYYASLLSDAFELVEAEPFRLPAVVKRTGETKYKKELVSLLKLVFRDALLFKTLKNSPSVGDVEAHLILRSERARTQKASERYSLTALVFAQKALTQAEKQIRFNAVFPQCLELCMAEIAARNDR